MEAIQQSRQQEPLMFEIDNFLLDSADNCSGPRYKLHPNSSLGYTVNRDEWRVDYYRVFENGDKSTTAPATTNGTTIPKIARSTKKGQPQTRFTHLQRERLELRFRFCPNIRLPERVEFATSLGLTPYQVQVWFQNRRSKWKRYMRGRVESGRVDGGGGPSSPQLFGGGF